jgi:glycosyltransferase involved in cell wall biosynthesis
MQRYEKEVCRAVRHVVAVSALDQKIMREEYGIAHVSSVQTGVDIDHFQPPPFTEPKADLIFVGSMDWLPNVDGARFFTTQILPAILARRPDCRIAFAGRKPDPAIQQMADRFPNLTVTGTVPDIRPWLWGSTVSIVPLRIGGGTRLKIYEAMAARIPVVSTAIGAEGLPLENGQHILVEDDPNRFADACLRLLEDHDTRRRIAGAAWSLIASRFSWTAVTREFEETLAANSLQSAASKITYA